MFFHKHSRAVVGPGPSVRYPSQSRRLDWEIELAIIIGKEGRRIPVERAMEHVASHTASVDLYARDWQFNPCHIKKFDMFGGKSFDDSAPQGPGMVPARFADPTDLSLKLEVNVVTFQDWHTRNMNWSVGEQIAASSQQMTLEPGDFTLTGYPAGVGFYSDSYLKVGDRVDAAISGIGTLTFEIIADPDTPSPKSSDRRCQRHSAVAGRRRRGPLPGARRTELEAIHALWFAVIASCSYAIPVSRCSRTAPGHPPSSGAGRPAPGCAGFPHPEPPPVPPLRDRRRFRTWRGACRTGS